MDLELTSIMLCGRQRDEVQISFDSIQATTARLLSQMEAKSSTPPTLAYHVIVCPASMHIFC